MSTTPEDDYTLCFVCKEQVRAPRVLSCLHVFCRACLTRHRGLTRTTACPMCNFETSPGVALERDCVFLQEYLNTCKSAPGGEDNQNGDVQNGASPCSDDVDRDTPDVDRETPEKDEDEREVISRGESSCSDREYPDRCDGVISPQDELFLQCSSHPHLAAEDFCPSCSRIICRKCVETTHKRCKDAVSLEEAVEDNTVTLNSVHERLARMCVATDEKVSAQKERLDKLGQQRDAAKVAVRQLREKLVNVILEKEQTMSAQIDSEFDTEIGRVGATVAQAAALGSCVRRSTWVLECAEMSRQGRAELLELKSGVAQRTQQYGFAEDQLCAGIINRNVTFNENESVVDQLQSLSLGDVFTTSPKPPSSPRVELGSPWEGKLSLVSSFHGGTREDISEPLLTDVLILGGGDVILTDRDNKCLKKFNSYGKVLTRVPIPDVPSRLAIVSHSKIAVTVMNKKLLLFFSIFGTLRVLAQIKTRKQYAYITGTTSGHLLAGTCNCDTIDVISQTGEFIRTLYTHKSEKGVISRPLYLAQAVKGHFLVSDSGRRMLYALDDDGSTRFTYKPKGKNALECPLGVARDAGDYILLADRDGNAINLISPKGELVKKILTETNSLVKPCGVCVQGQTTLAITQVDGYVKVYKAETN